MIMNVSIFVCFFFKQKTAYEMRISDGSSDVCSSDLVGPCGGFSIAEHLEAGVFSLFGGRGTGAQGDGDFCHAGIAQVLGVGMALTAIADNGDFLALDQADVSVTIIINTHFDNFPSTRFTSPPHVRGGYENPSPRSEEHTSELQSLMRKSYAVFCLKKKTYT